jgi:hypothetical protein
MSPPGVDRLQLMLPDGERNDAGPFAADCTTTVVGAGAGSAATVTVTGAGAAAGAGAGVAVTVTVGAGAAAGLGAWAEPAVEEHPARANAASARSHS